MPYKPLDKLEEGLSANIGAELLLWHVKIIDARGFVEREGAYMFHVPPRTAPPRVSTLDSQRRSGRVARSGG